MPSPSRRRSVGPTVYPCVHRPILFVIAVLVAFTAATPIAARDDFADVRRSLRSDVREQTAGRLSYYRLDVAIDAAAGTIGGTQEIAYRNASPDTLGEIFFRLYPNADHYGAGGTVVHDARVDGKAVIPSLEVEDTALRLPLPTPLAPGAEARIVFAFETTVPLDSLGSYGIFGRDSVDGTWMLADWHPVLAVYEPGDGWQLDPPTSFGDPTHAEASMFDVAVRAPEGLSLVASGVETEEDTATGSTIRHFVAGPAREFTLVADDDHVARSRRVEGTTVTIHAEPELDPTVAERSLDAAARSLAVFSRRFGPYPYAELDLVQTRLDRSYAVAWAGLIFLDGEQMLGGFSTNDPDGFETVVAHEVAHQWWGVVVGSDSNAHTFVNEGLATLSSLVYLEATTKASVAEEQFRRWVVEPAAALLRSGDAVVDVPIADGQDAGIRAWAAYGKGTLGFLAIREEIGDAAFDRGLRSYAERFRFGIAAPADLRVAWEAASGVDLAPLWTQWFDRAEMSLAQIDAVAAGFAAGA